MAYVTVNLAGAFGAKRVKIVRSKPAGKDEYTLEPGNHSPSAPPPTNPPRPNNPHIL